MATIHHQKRRQPDRRCNGCVECTVDSQIDGYYGIYADAYEITLKWTRISIPTDPPTSTSPAPAALSVPRRLDEASIRALITDFGIPPIPAWAASTAHGARDLVGIQLARPAAALNSSTLTGGAAKPPSSLLRWRGRWQRDVAAIDPYPYYGAVRHQRRSLLTPSCRVPVQFGFTASIVFTNDWADRRQQHPASHLTIWANLEDLIYLGAGYSAGDHHYWQELPANRLLDGLHSTRGAQRYPDYRQLDQWRSGGYRQTGGTGVYITAGGTAGTRQQ